MDKKELQMKSIYIFLTRSGTVLSHLVYTFTKEPYTHVSVAFDDDLGTLYSSSRKNGYTLFPAGPCREFLNQGLFTRWGKIPCAVYELRVEDHVYHQARQLAEEMVSQDFYHFNIFGLLLCKLNIRLQRQRHFFCSQFVSEVLRQSQALELPKDSVLMRPSDFLQLSGLRCLYCGLLKDLPQRQRMQLGEPVSMTTVYFHLMMAAARRSWQRMR